MFCVCCFYTTPLFFFFFVVGRHKHTEANGRPAETPDGFWDLSFADSVSSNKAKDLLLQQQRRPFAGDRGGAGADGDKQRPGDDLSLDF